jgi:elongation factor Ts
MTDIDHFKHYNDTHGHPQGDVILQQVAHLLRAQVRETDFVARSEKFQSLVKEVALHVAAMNPRYVRKEDIPEDVIAEESSIAREQLKAQGKPEAIMDKMVAGKLEKWYTEHCLLLQPYVKDETKTVGDLVAEAQSALGEKLEIGRFVRFQI